MDLTHIYHVNHFTENCFHFDVLIFLVGLAHAKGKGKDLSAFEKVNYQTLVNLLSALDAQGKIPRKIIFASTISVYGERLNQNIYNETLIPKPFSPYAITKLLGEQYLLNNFSSQTWVLRFSPVYSSDFLLNIDRRTKMRCMNYKVGDGTKKLSLCNIKNILTVIEEIIAGVVPAGVYNISDSTAYTYNELLQQKGAVPVLQIPKLLIRLLYYFGKIVNIIFLKENSIKLLTDNIFTSDKIMLYTNLKSTIYELGTNDD